MRVRKDLHSILEQCDLLEDHLKYSEHESTREHARGALWAAETIREHIFEYLKNEPVIISMTSNREVLPE